MTKPDLVNHILSKAEIAKVAAEKALNSFIEGIISNLKKDEKVSFWGFGIFF